MKLLFTFCRPKGQVYWEKIFPFVQLLRIFFFGRKYIEEKKKIIFHLLLQKSLVALNYIFTFFTRIKQRLRNILDKKSTKKKTSQHFLLRTSSEGGLVSNYYNCTVLKQISFCLQTEIFSLAFDVFNTITPAFLFIFSPTLAFNFFVNVTFLNSTMNTFSVCEVYLYVHFCPEILISKTKG